MAQRPGQVDAASRRVFDSVGPSTTIHHGRTQVGRTAEGLVNETRGIINNQATDPLYKMAERVTIPPADMGGSAIYLVGAKRRTRSRTPANSPAMRGMSEDSVGFANEVKSTRSQGKNAAAPVNAIG